MARRNDKKILKFYPQSNFIFIKSIATDTSYSSMTDRSISRSAAFLISYIYLSKRIAI